MLMKRGDGRDRRVELFLETGQGAGGHVALVAGGGLADAAVLFFLGEETQFQLAVFEGGAVEEEVDVSAGAEAVAEEGVLDLGVVAELEEGLAEVGCIA